MIGSFLVVAKNKFLLLLLINDLIVTKKRGEFPVVGASAPEAALLSPDLK
jgi:hypothetical protein